MMIFAVVEEGRKGEPMVDKELIENWRNMVKPSISSLLFKTNYEGMGEQDKEEFERDFDEILDLALVGLERTEERTETRACDWISRQAAIDALDIINGAEEVLRSLPPAQPVATDTIRRQAAKEAYCKHFCYRGVACPDNLCKEVNEAFDKLPPAQPERKTGTWIPYDTIPRYVICRCSACGTDILVPCINDKTIFNYCPNCGAKMEEKQYE